MCPFSVNEINSPMSHEYTLSVWFWLCYAESCLQPPSCGLPSAHGVVVVVVVLVLGSSWLVLGTVDVCCSSTFVRAELQKCRVSGHMDCVVSFKMLQQSIYLPANQKDVHGF